MPQVATAPAAGSTELTVPQVGQTTSIISAMIARAQAACQARRCAGALYTNVRLLELHGALVASLSGTAERIDEIWRIAGAVADGAPDLLL